MPDSRFCGRPAGKIGGELATCVRWPGHADLCSLTFRGEKPTPHERLGVDPNAGRVGIADVCIRRPDTKQFLVVTNKRHEGWTLPGGKIDSGEKPREAAIRELREETGIDVSETDTENLLYLGHFDYRWREIDIRLHAFVAHDDAWVGQVPVAVEAGTEVRWVSRDDLIDADSGCLAPVAYGWLMAKMDWNSHDD